MKRIGNLYKDICSITNIYDAYRAAKVGKYIIDKDGKAEYSKEIMNIQHNEKEYLEKLQEMLINKTFKNSEYFIFKKIDKGKEREIYSLPFYPDRIIHHAIMQILEPIWKKTLITDTYQSIKGRGIHKAKNKIQKVIRKEDIKYSLKIDIKKFYPSIKNDILKTIIRKKIKCKDTLWLLDEIIDSTEGVPIGNYISQYFGNLYLTYMDHHLKEEIKVKYYFRYCDDITILSSNKEELHYILGIIKDYVHNKLDLELKSNYQIYTINEGVDFLGYRFFKEYTLLRKSIATRFKRAAKKFVEFPLCGLEGIASYYGWIKNSDSYHLWYKYTNCKNYKELNLKYKEK